MGRSRQSFWRTSLLRRRTSSSSLPPPDPHPDRSRRAPNSPVPGKQRLPSRDRNFFGRKSDHPRRRNAGQNVPDESERSTDCGNRDLELVPLLGRPPEQRAAEDHVLRRIELKDRSLHFEL